MGALAATRGWQILVAVPNPPLVTLAHEVIDVLQGQPAGQAAEPRLTREDATAEIEAARLAQEIAAPGFQPGGPIPIAGELSAAAISLQRSALAEPAPGGVAIAEQPQELFDTAVSERPEPEPAAEPAPAAPAGVTAAGEGAPAGVAGEREGAPAAAGEEAVAAFELPPAPARSESGGRRRARRGDLLWASTFVGLGWLAGEPFFRVLAVVMAYAGSAAGFFAAALALYLGFKLLQRLRFQTELRVASLSARELKRRLDAGDDLVVVDLRHRREVEESGTTLPGALCISPDELDAGTGRSAGAGRSCSSVVDPTSGRAPGWRSG